MLDLLSPLTLAGVLWTLFVLYMLYLPGGRSLSSRPALLLLTGPLMLASVWYVSAEVDVIRTLAGGVTPLDVHYNYGQQHIVALAEALGEAGRPEYARFQLGADTLAPPAFAGFILNVNRSTVRLPRMRLLITVMISVYFFSVLLANTLMPVVMLSFPDNTGFVGLLYSVVPVLDLMKYSVHGLAWLTILGCWLWQGTQFLRRRWLIGR